MLKKEKWEGEKRGDLPHAFMDDCICIQTSQHALLCHSGRNPPAAPNQPWPFTTSPWGRVCASWVSECICVCLHVCEFKREGAHTSVNVCAFMDTELRTTLPLWFIFKQTAQPSRLPHLRFSLPLSSTLHLSDAYRQSIHPPNISPLLPSLNPSLLPIILLLHPFLHASLHPSICIYFPAGKTISWIPLKWKDFTFNTSPTLVMCPSFRGRGSKEERKEEEGVRRDFWWVDGWKRWWHYLYQNMSVSLNLSKSNFSGSLRSFRLMF